MKKITSTLIIISLLTISCRGRNRSVEHKRSEIMMDTLVEVTVRNCGEKNIGLAFDEMRKAEAALSRFNPDGELSAINASAGKAPVQISPSTWSLLKIAAQVADETGGAFDPTIGPAVRMWSRERSSPPDEAEIEEIRKKVGWRKIKLLNGNKVFIEEGTSVNLDAIAKGYVVDRGLGVLKQNGCAAVIINAGGDVGFFSSSDSPDWAIKIEDAASSADNVVIHARDGGVATSGVGRRFSVIGGVRYCHVLDPKTMRPISGEITAASAYADDATLADAWATAALVRGESLFKKADEKNIGLSLHKKNGVWESNRAWKSRTR